jgi:hypothetical protein
MKNNNKKKFYFVDSVEETEEKTVEENKSLKNKPYFSFEFRVVTSIIAVFLLFILACFFAVEAISTNIYTINYDETSTTEYSVCYNENTEYSNKCITENMSYVSSLIKNIYLSFTYNVDLSDKIDSKIEYYVVGKSIIYDKDDTSKILYENKDNLLENVTLENTSNNINFTADIDLDFNKYNNFVTEYLNKYDLNAQGKYEVILYVKDNVETRPISTVTFNLGEQTVTINKTDTSNLNNKVDLDEGWSDYSSSCATIAVVLLLISLYLIIMTTRLVTKVVNNKSKYTIKLTNILKEYDDIIVISRDGYEIDNNKKIIKVDEFKELLDARETLNKPIIYSRVNDIKSDFFVEDDNTIFKYTLKETDFK